jgi:hypothetical protein
LQSPVPGIAGQVFPTSGWATTIGWAVFALTITVLRFFRAL